MCNTLKKKQQQQKHTLNLQACLRFILHVLILLVG